MFLHSYAAKLKYYALFKRMDIRHGDIFFLILEFSILMSSFFLRLNPTVTASCPCTSSPWHILERW